MQLLTAENIAAVSALAACLTAVATFLTVRQISRQRTASYQPELVVARAFFEAVANEGQSISHEWKSRGGKGPASSNGFALRLYNLGLGSAKDVCATWSLDVEALVRKANDAAQRAMAQAYFSFKDGVLETKSAGSGGGMSMWENQKNFTYDFILPISRSAELAYIPVPLAYMQLVSAIVRYGCQLDKLDNFPEVDPLKLDITFKDIADNSYNRSFLVEFEYNSVINKGEEFHASLKCSSDGHERRLRIQAA